MNLARKQIQFRKPVQVSLSVNEGIRAVAEQYTGTIQSAVDHCLVRIADLTEARLTSVRKTNPPKFTRDGQSFVTLIWVLLIDGLIPYRQPALVREWLVKTVDATDLLEKKLNEDNLAILAEIFVDTVKFSDGYDTPTVEDITQTLRRVWAGVLSENGEQREMPILNRLFVGRDKDIEIIYERIGINGRLGYQPLNIVRGWPGVGKTALVNTIVHDDTVRSHFSDGVLWSSLGYNIDMVMLLKSWARQMGAVHLLKSQNLQELIVGLRQVLRGKDIFILADDVWTTEDGSYIKQIVDLKTNTVLLTTRFTAVANQLKDLEKDIYVLKPLSEEYAMELLKILAPEPVRLHHDRIPQLIKVLEGLPLALRVAGPTLQHYHDMHFDIPQLIDEFENDYNRLLDSVAPNDRFDEETGKTPTIELLFQRSVETLSEEAQVAFAALGVFKQKPATFAIDALQSVWDVSQPQILVENLIGRGLMEAIPERRYQVHQTLHMYANKLLDMYEDE